MALIESESTPAKKRRIRMKKKKKAAAAKQEEEDRPSAKPENALFYLRNWAKRQDTEWKFKKSQQVYLLKNGLSMNMSEDDFCIFCEYMAGLAGNAKTGLHQQAQQIVDDDKKDGEDIQDRARRLIQSLTPACHVKQVSSSESSDESESD